MEDLSTLQLPLNGPADLAMALLPVGGGLEVYTTADQVAIFCRGLCIFTFAANDRFSRNYCIVQLYQSGNFKLKYISELFRLNYQHCSKILGLFKRFGLEGLKEEADLKSSNRKVIDAEIGAAVFGARDRGASYEDIANEIRFKFRKKISAKSIRNWVSRENRAKKQSAGTAKNELCLPNQLLMEVGQAGSDFAPDGSWHRNIYAGSMMLYSVLDRSNLLKLFDENLREDFSRRAGSSGCRRVILTVFFLHALRLKNIEQSKYLVDKDFSQIIGGSFLRTQSLRYAIDEIINTEGFDRALDMYFKGLIFLTERRNRIFYTDGHFSNYYGGSNVPMGYDPRRQAGARGRTSVYLHNTEGEVMFLFESATNTSLSNDIETLVTELARKGMKLKRKTLFFDRGGYSKKCFSFLQKNKMYFVTYLKYRKKERQIAETEFAKKLFQTENECCEYFVCETERRWAKGQWVRIIVFIGREGRQIPIITNNVFLRPETIIFYLQKRWREENCFKYMIEHFGIDLLTSYKIEEAPDKVIYKPNPARTSINRLIASKKLELQKLQSEFANQIIEGEIFGFCVGDKLLKEQDERKLKIKNLKIDIELMKLDREKISSKIEINLKENNVIMAQKRRLFLNAIKALNYNSEKWLQKVFQKFHAKEDEILSLIRNLIKQPGQIRANESIVEVVVEPFESKAMRETVEMVLDGIGQNGGTRLPDGRLLRIKMMR